MEMIRFEWDERKNRINLKKHGVTFQEASTVFEDDNALVIDDPAHSEQEERFIILRFSHKANLLVVCHCYRSSDSVITARLKDLMIRPPCGPKERMRSKEDRLTASQRVVMFHQPSAMDLDLYTSIDNCLRWGYVCRNPLSARYANIFTQLDRGDPSVTG